MGQTILFSEMESEDSYRTAVGFSKLPGYAVYVLHKEGERKAVQEAIRVIEIEERTQEKLASAMEQIGAEQGGIDMLVLSAGKHCAQDGSITDGHDYEALLETIDANVIGTLETVQAALGLMRKGKSRRIALLTEKASSINLNKDVQDYGYFMSLSALNMMMKVLFNTLRPEGFTFRCYAADGCGGMAPQTYFSGNLCYDKDDAYIHSDENRIVMRDRMLCEIPW